MNTDIPEQLNIYFESHLKIMATIQDENDVDQWGIFFSIKDEQKDGDEDFHGQIADGKTLSWNQEKTIWIIPLTKSAKKKITENEDGSSSIEIAIRKLRICNVRKLNGGGNYSYYYRNGEDNSKDFFLELPRDEKLAKLEKRFGALVRLLADGDDDQWPVWIASNEGIIEKSIITINAPKCHIINDKGIYIDHTIVIGLGRRKAKNCPVLTIANSTITEQDSIFKDVPFVWRPDFGDYDLVTTESNGRLAITGKETSVWNKSNTFETYNNDNAWNYAKSIVKDANNNDKPTGKELRQWFYCNTESDVYQNKVYPLYFKKYKLNDNVYDLERNTIKLRGRELLVTCFQLCKPSKINIYTVIHNFGEQAFKSFWSEQTKIARSGIRSLKASSQVGLAPNILDIEVEQDGKFVCEWEAEYQSDRCLPNYSYNLTSSLWNVQDTNAIEDIRVELPLIRLASGYADFVNLQCNLNGFTHQERVNDNGTFFRFGLEDYQIEGLDNDESFKIIDGSLSFNLENPKKASERFASCRLTLQSKQLQRAVFLWQLNEDLKNDDIYLSYTIEEFKLIVTSPEPHGEDLTSQDRLVAPSSFGSIGEGAGERSEPPLIIPIDTEVDPELNDGQKENEEQYYLTFNESLNFGQDYRFDVKLEEFEPTTIKDKSRSITAVVLNSNPHLVALVQARFLQQTGYDDGAWIIARRNQLSRNPGRWELLDDAAITKGFVLGLPAQAIGEAYVRGVTDKNSEGTKSPEKEPQENEPVPYRFGQPTILRVSPDSVEGRYVPAPWNLLKVLTKYGGSAPGVPLNELQWELLYGLQGHATPEKAFLTELAGKLGEVPVPPRSQLVWVPTKEQEDAFKEAWVEYSKVYRAWRSRLAILEPMLANGKKTAVFDDNISYRLRIKVDPSDKDKGQFKRTGASLRYPVNPLEFKYVPETGGQLTEAAIENNRIKKIHDKDGLAGGATYGFEQGPVYEEFLRENFKTGSSSGYLQDPAFSSLGGWGKQTARFAQDKTAIISSTNMGRTNVYSVERIGRIGVLWHRAKHVIVYERTVAPSKQFAPYQKGFLGRPLVRKVKEYVEILEPVRRYPDFSGQIESGPGPILSCKFNSKIIPVLSGWGRDVKLYKEDNKKLEVVGWEVPLWNSEEDKTIYPKPQVIFNLLPPPAAKVNSIPVNIDQPENLYFYTDTRSEIINSEGEKIKISSNTDLWPPVPEVDFTILPQPPIYDISPGRETNLDAEMPSSLDVSPGFERFTFRLTKSGIPSSVTGRYYPDSEVAAFIRTVTFTRKTSISRRLSTVKNDDPSKPLNDILNDLLYGKPTKPEEKPVLQKLANGFVIQDNIVLSQETLPKLQDYVRALEDNLGVMRNGTTVEYPSFLKIAAGNFAKLGDNQFVYYSKEYLDGWNDDSLKYSKPKELWGQAVLAAEAVVTKQVRAIDDNIKEILASITRNKYSEEKPVFIKLLNDLKAKWLNAEIEPEYLPNTYLELYQKAVPSVIQNFKNVLIKFVVNVEEEFAGLDDSASIETLREDAKQILGELQQLLGNKNELENLPIQIKKPLQTLNNLKEELQIGKEKIGTYLYGQMEDEISKFIATAGEAVNADMRDPKIYLNSVKNAIHIAQAKLDTYDICDEVSSLVLKELMELRRTKLSEFSSLIHKAWEKKAVEIIDPIINPIKDKIHNYDEKNDPETLIFDLIDNYKPLKELNESMISDHVKNFIRDIHLDVSKKDGVQLYKEVQDVTEEYEKFKSYPLFSVIDLVENAGMELVEEWISRYEAFDDLGKAILKGTRNEMLEHSVTLANLINEDVGSITGRVAKKYKELEYTTKPLKESFIQADQSLKNIRSVWEEVSAPGMRLNRKKVELLFREEAKNTAQRLAITPVVNKLNQIEGQVIGEAKKRLDGLGLRLPVVALTDQFETAKKNWENVAESYLDKFDFSKIISDIGGIKLDKLFPNFKMPEAARDHIKLSQGFDKQQSIAWADAIIDYKLPRTTELLTFGPLNIALAEGRLTGKVNLKTDSTGKTTKINNGELRGSFIVSISGTPIMIFRNVGILYDNNNIDFDIDPRRMEMPGLLKMLTDASQNISKTGATGTDAEGNKVEPLKVGLIKIGELPAGVKAELNFPPTTVAGGVSGISGLSFGAHFLLSFLTLDRSNKPDFRFLLGIGFYLGKKEAPFNIIIFILGGGGYVDCSLTFSPEKGLAVDFALSILASATLALNAGWANGYVLIALGIEIYYQKPRESKGVANVTIFVALYGKVDILSLATLYVSILLEASYRPAGGKNELIGIGRIRAKIKICRFVTVRVNKSFRKVLAKG